MKYKHITYFLTLLALLLALSCSKQESKFAQMALYNGNHPELLGRSINISAYYSELYNESRSAGYNSDGSFNNGDRMHIYREFLIGSSYESGKTYRVYSLNLVSKLGWLPLKGQTMKENGAYSTQTDADSLTWNSNGSVRFRAFCRSNFEGCISNNQSTYYPDFSISEWVATAGPATTVPFRMNHLCSRIIFSSLDGGDCITKVEISTKVEDYQRGGVDVETATQRANAVKAVYDRMCMPSGVDIQTGMLYAMPKSVYASSNLSNVENEVRTEAHVGFGAYSESEISENIQRPVFASGLLRGSCHFLTIPYDMSSDTDKQGELLVLPPFTRFTVTLLDVNNGDSLQVSGTEGPYHILSLSDIKNSDGSLVFPDGLMFKPNVSTQFKVGYRYGHLVVKHDESLCWERQTDMLVNAEDKNVDAPENEFEWWQTAMNEAAATALATNDYQPSFEITSEAQLISFATLVNGTMPIPAPLNRAFTRVGGQKVTGWYNTIYEGDTLWLRVNKVDMPGAALENYIFYDHYYPQDGDVKAYVMEDYLTTHYPFSEKTMGNKHFTVTLSNDLDMTDWNVGAIGSSNTSAFEGYFEGARHTIKNLHVASGYMFGYISGGAVRNLNLTSVHKTAVAQNCTDSFIIGVSIKADSPGASVVENTNGECYLVGCNHIGNATGGLVGTANGEILMYGCLQVAEGIPANSGALCTLDNFGSLAPQSGAVKWDNFMCNYYDITLSPNTIAASGVSNNYRAQEYIRGVSSSVIKAYYDLFLPAGRSYSSLSAQEKLKYYGVAPWRAMNSAIYVYNTGIYGFRHPCNAHYEIPSYTSGYNNLYPQLSDGQPSSASFVDVTTEPN